MKIFLIVFDTLRKDHTGKIYGNDWIQTPNFDEFAKDSLVFDKAYPESLPTIPVRRAIHTGIRTFPFNQDLKVRTDDFVESPGWTPIPHDQIHISEYLNKAGHLTSFITSTYHQFKPNMNFQLGFDEWHFVRGHEYDKYKPSWKGRRSELNKLMKNNLPKKTKENRFALRIQKTLLKKYFTNKQDWESEEDYMPAKTFKRAIQSIKESKDTANHFCIIDEFDPHEPWDPPENYYNLYKDKEYSGNKIILPIYGESVNLISSEELRNMKACYAGEVSLCDAWFGYFINQLKELEFYEDALIILISDHGHGLGEHGAIGKVPKFMYPELIDIPLIIKPPGNINGPIRIDNSYVYDHDLLATIYGFLGKEKPKKVEGKDLSVFVDNTDAVLEGRDYMTCGMSLWTAYKDDKYALITRNTKKDRKLFDLRDDPEWNTNIIEGNESIYEKLFRKIEEDANGELLKEYKSERFENFEDWYHNTYLL
ncbi:MAG: sulfatase [Promethearchaeia archaeon]